MRNSMALRNQGAQDLPYCNKQIFKDRPTVIKEQIPNILKVVKYSTKPCTNTLLSQLFQRTLTTYGSIPNEHWGTEF